MQSSSNTELSIQIKIINSKIYPANENLVVLIFTSLRLKSE